MTKSDYFLSCFWRDESGSSAAEYALMLAIVATGIGLAAGTLGAAVAGAMDNASTCINGIFPC